MDQFLDFSFHKGNPFAVADDLESPTPMPSPPVLPITDTPDSSSQKENQLPLPKEPAESSLQSSVEIVETLSIAAAPTTDKTAVEDAEKIAKTCTFTTEEPSPRVPKPRPRGKVPLERGFTQMNWLKLIRTQPDLAGLKGRSNKRLVSMEEVKQHQSEDDAWTVLRGRVYNVSPYLKFHPGGIDMLMQGAGEDCTPLFNEYHAWVNAEFLLEKCLIGHLDVLAQKADAEGKSS